MKTISPARLIHWIKNRLLAAEHRIATGDVSGSKTAEVYDGLFEKAGHIARGSFEFTTSEFAEQFELDTHEAMQALNELAESDFVRHVAQESFEDIWVATQVTVIQMATSHRYGVLTTNTVKSFAEHPNTRAVLRRILAEPNVLRIVLGGNWLNKHARSRIGAAVVIDGNEVSESLVANLEELGKRMDGTFRAEHTLPPLILPASESFPTLFHNAITISPIINWRTSRESTSRACDKEIAEQLRKQWNANQDLKVRDRNESDSLMVHAFAMRHFQSGGKPSQEMHRHVELDSSSKACSR